MRPSSISSTASNKCPSNPAPSSVHASFEREPLKNKRQSLNIIPPGSGSKLDLSMSKAGAPLPVNEKSGHSQIENSSASKVAVNVGQVPSLSTSSTQQDSRSTSRVPMYSQVLHNLDPSSSGSAGGTSTFSPTTKFDRTARTGSQMGHNNHVVSNVYIEGGEPQRFFTTNSTDKYHNSSQDDKPHEPKSCLKDPSTAENSNRRKRSVSFSRITETIIIPSREDTKEQSCSRHAKPRNTHRELAPNPVHDLPVLRLVPSSVPAGTPGDSRYSSISFEAPHQTNPGVMVKCALTSSVPGNNPPLKDADDLVLAKVEEKEIVICLSWPGYPRVVHRMVKLTHSRKELITRQALLCIIAEAIMTYAAELLAHHPTSSSPSDRHWNLGDHKSFDPRDIVITRLIHHAGQTWFPEMWIRERRMSVQ